MSSKNFVHLEGRLMNSDVRYVPSGKAVVSLNVGVANPGKDKGFSYVNVEYWEPNEKTIDLINRATGKANIIVIGRLRQDRWEDKEGKKRNVLKIAATSIAFPTDIKVFKNKDEQNVERSQVKQETQTADPVQQEIDDFPF
jgi:single-strand DNA-binding protein